MLSSLNLVPKTGPGRRLVALTLVQSAGNGLFLTSSVVFFVRVVGLRPGQVGLGLSLAGLAGFLITVPIGRLADRHGARRFLTLDHAALAVLFTLYPLARSFTSFAIVASFISMAEVSSSPLRSAMLSTIFEPQSAVRTRAQMRSAFNVGFLLGGAAAGAILAAASYPTFWVVCLINAFAQGVCAIVVSRLKPLDRRLDESPEQNSGRKSGALSLGFALRDTHFVLLTLSNGLLELHATVLTIGAPLWIVSHTKAPASFNSVLIIINTLIVLLLQVRLSHGASDVPRAARLQRRAGVALALGCVVCASSSGSGAVASVLSLLAGIAILAVGEIWQAAGAWGLSFELPPAGRQGEYQAVFGLGRGIQQLAGPALVTALLVGVGALGWLVLAVLFLVMGFCCRQLAIAASQRCATPSAAS
jgi:MFS family permease